MTHTNPPLQRSHRFPLDTPFPPAYGQFMQKDMPKHPQPTEADAKFGRYLVGEFFWELDQHNPRPSGFVDVQRDSVEVLSFRGYHEMRIRIGDDVFDVHLSWRKDVPPRIHRVKNLEHN